MNSKNVKISNVNSDIVEEKIANLILKYRKDITVEDAERIAVMAKHDPLLVLNRSKLDILYKYFDSQSIVIN